MVYVTKAMFRLSGDQDATLIVPCPPKNFARVVMAPPLTAIMRSATSLLEKDISNPRTGLIVGSGGPSTKAIVSAADITRQNSSPKRVGPFAVPKAMSSTCSANLSTWFKTKGYNYSISSTMGIW